MFVTTKSVDTIFKEYTLLKSNVDRTFTRNFFSSFVEVDISDRSIDNVIALLFSKQKLIHTRKHWQTDDRFTM